MHAEILFENIWRLGFDWNELQPKEFQNKFQNSEKNIAVPKYWRINRCYFPVISWRELSGLELHTYGGASEKGYGVCVDGTSVVARSRVAPVNKAT